MANAKDFALMEMKAAYNTYQAAQARYFVLKNDDGSGFDNDALCKVYQMRTEAADAWTVASRDMDGEGACFDAKFNRACELDGEVEEFSEAVYGI
jgi:hypothetical protein